MSLMGKLASVVAGAGLLASDENTSAQGMMLYDDFNSGNVNLSLWSVGSGVSVGAGGNLDEAFVQNQAFHTQQNNITDRGNSLDFTRTFSSGDIVQYSVDYLNGSGNRMSSIKVDGVGNYTSLFGFWNSLGDGGVGNDFGRYNVRLSFLGNGILPEITVPSGEIRTTRTIIPYPVAGINNHAFGVVTRTGHNGSVGMDYDNFFVGQIPEPTTSLLFLGGLSAIALSGMRKKR